MNLFLAILVGKILRFASRIAGVGGGSAAPGYYAMKLYPKLIEKLSSQIPSSVMVTGTNGKTTTARMIAHFSRDQKFRIIHNSTGSNMERGIASELIESANLFGKIKNIDLAVWEVDEAGVKILGPKIKPQIIIFLNAARDQLDRYGELDSLVREWEEAISRIDYAPKILINNDDASTQRLTKIPNLEFESFGLDKRVIDWEKNSRTGAKTDFLASNIKEHELDSISFKLSAHNLTHQIYLPLPGIYHTYDFLAAFAACYHLNLNIPKVIESAKSYTPAFGRVEKINLKGYSSYILLIKNPNGTAQAFSTIIPKLEKDDRLLLVLNNNIADGTDVSWIWDAPFEALSELKQRIYCSGKRAYDLALRLKYADCNQVMIEPDLSRALDLAQDNLKGRLFILPTYTALLNLQKILASQGVKKHYWKDEQ